MYRIMLVAGNPNPNPKAITRKWLKTEGPKMKEWVEVIQNIYMMETFSVRLESGQFKNF